MNKHPYAKPALTYQQQIQQLKDRGLHFEDEYKARYLLENVSYYRLSGYWYPLLADKTKHLFKPDSSFEKAFSLYCFDRELRHLINSELEKIEVAVRAKMIYVLSHANGPFWFQDSALFKKPSSWRTTFDKITVEYNRSDEEFIVAFRTKYSDALPPAWMILEIASFGTLSKLYSNLISGHEKRMIATYFGLADKVLENWLHCIVYLRNICAHHSRLWNKALSIRPVMPQTPKKTWIVNKNIRTDRIYALLCMIRFLLQTVNTKSNFTERLVELLSKYPHVDSQAMGFPTDWQSELLWKRKIL